MTSSKKLFVVTAEIEVIVLAESREEAEKITNEQRLHDVAQGELGWHAQEMTWIPADWDISCLPFSDDQHDCQTIGELIDAGAAPTYSTLLAAHNKRETSSSSKKPSSSGEPSP